MNARSGPEQQVIYEFGDFRLDVSRQQLFAKGESTAVAIKPKVFDALLYFVEHPDRLLEKERLMAELWPGLVVEENGLSQVISALRHALGEAPGDNRYLVTVHGRGYRFVAKVELLPDAAASPESPPIGAATIAAPAHVDRESSRRPAFVVLVALAGVLGVAFATYGGSSRWWRAGGTSPSGTTLPQVATDLPARTVAVLRFESLSDDADDAHIAFGVAESVLHRLATIEGLTLIARTSSFAVVDKSTDIRDIGRRLNARYLVEGSLQRSGERLRVTAQLIDATTGGHLWSLRFDRTIGDIFTVEDEIAQNIATALTVSLDRDRHPYAVFGTEAYLQYLQGRSLVATSRIDDAERAIERFSSAIELAPKFAAAYAAKADAYMHLVYLRSNRTGFPLKGRAGLPGQLMATSEAKLLLDEALRLDDSLGEAYILRADLKIAAGDAAGVEDDYRKGLTLSPSYGGGHERFAEYLQLTERTEEAMAELDKAILIDPLAPLNYYFKGSVYLFMPEPAVFATRAETYFLKALELAPDYHPALLRLGIIRWYQGRFAEAALLGERALAIDPHAQWMRWFLVEFYVEMGEVDAARSVLLDAPDTVQPIRWLTICLYEQQPERAAELLRAEPGMRRFRDIDVPSYAIRDAARASGQLARGRDELQGLPIRDDFVLSTLAELNHEMGEREQMEPLARDLLEHHADAGESSDRYRLAYPASAAFTLLGLNDEALTLLEEAFERGYRKMWWYAFDRDPAFEPLRGDPRFQALAAKAEAHAAAERASLRQMRERGEVPNRGVNTAASPGAC